MVLRVGHPRRWSWRRGGIAAGASSNPGGGYPPEAAANNWPVFFNWLAAVYEAVTTAETEDGAT
jgi:hypothetical protein